MWVKHERRIKEKENVLREKKQNNKKIQITAILATDFCWTEEKKVMRIHKHNLFLSLMWNIVSKY